MAREDSSSRIEYFGMRNPDYRAMLLPLRFLMIFQYGGLIP